MKNKVRSIITILTLVCMMFSTMCVFSDSTEVANPASDVMTKETFTASNGVELPYRMYVPKDYSSEKEYSFLLFLHGAGNRGSENKSQVSENMGLVNRIIGGETVTYNGATIDTSKEFIIIAPQCQTEYQWVDTSWSVTPDPSYKLDEIPQSQYMTAVVELIDETSKKYNLDESRMYATGLSMGGFGTWDLLMRYPKLFAAAIPMGGAGDTSKADIIAQTPVWTFHQLHDPVVSSAGTVAMVKALVEVGAEVKFTPYFDTIHNAWKKGYAEADLLQWLYNHTKEKSDKPKIAFVGDSITYGAGVSDIATEAYPSIIKANYGDDFEIGNFGVSATSALSTAKYPYIETREYKDSLDFGADILFIMLGTNDIKNENWDEGKGRFEDDYVALIDSYKKVNPEVKVYVGIPPRIFKENVFGERSPQILENEGIPAIYSVAQKVGAEVVDFFNPTKDMPELFPDYLHPDAEGNKIMAQIVSDSIFKDDAKAQIITDGASDWAKGEIALSYAAGIVPESVASDYLTDITRKDFCEMVVNILPDDLTQSREAKFEDCDNDAVNYAYSVGVINGMSDTVFAPDSFATREEMATMLCRAYKLIAPEAVAENDGAYPDKDSISEWALESVNFVNAMGIMNGDDDGNIMPSKTTSRQEAILLVYRAYCSAYYYGKE